MADKDQRLSYEELVALLQKSSALQHRRGAGEFGKDDVLAAARELGIDPAVTAEVVDTHLARRRAVDLAPRPFDSRVQLESSPEIFALKIPPVRLQGRDLAQLGFLVFWLAFVAFWTNGARHGGGIFAAFSIPFWLVGLGMMGRLLRPLVQTTKITLGREAGSLQIAPLGKRRSLKTGELRTRLGEAPERQVSSSRRELPRPALLLEHGTETFALLEGFSEQEQRWIESELRAWLQNQ